jgi:chemotaxis protein CheZ
MNTQARLGTALLDSLAKLRRQKGGFDMQDVGVLFEHLAATINQHHEGPAETFLKDEIEKLALFIGQAKNEVSGMASADGTQKASGDATQHLDAVIKATEEASTSIMDAADAIQTAAAGIGGEREQAISDATIKIYEACNFQDLTGQRLTKVITVLDEIDRRIGNVLKLFGEADGDFTPSTVIPLNTPATGDASLLNGPQLPGSAPSQADIDALFGN